MRISWTHPSKRSLLPAPLAFIHLLPFSSSAGGAAGDRLFGVLPGRWAAICGANYAFACGAFESPGLLHLRLLGRFPLFTTGRSSSLSTFCKPGVLWRCCSRFLVASLGFPHNFSKAPTIPFSAIVQIPCSILPNGHPSGQGIRPKLLTSDLPHLIKFTQHIDKVFFPVLPCLDTCKLRM